MWITVVMYMEHWNKKAPRIRAGLKIKHLRFTLLSHLLQKSVNKPLDLVQELIQIFANLIPGPPLSIVVASAHLVSCSDNGPPCLVCYLALYFTGTPAFQRTSRSELFD